MFKSWSSWLGAEPVNEDKTDKPEATEEQNNTGDQTEDQSQQILQQAKGLSGEIHTHTTLYVIIFYCIMDIVMFC